MPDLQQLPNSELLERARQCDDEELINRLSNLALDHMNRHHNPNDPASPKYYGMHVHGVTLARILLDGGGEEGKPELRAAAIVYCERLLREYGARIEFPEE